MKDDSSTMFAGGAIVVIVIVVVCLKAIQEVFIQLGKTFDALGKMAGSFFYMAWNGVLALGLISLGIACVWAAGYFSYKYYLMVKRGTEIEARVDAKISGLIDQVNTSIKELKAQNNERVARLELKLREALEKPAIAPLPAGGTLLPAPAKLSDTANSDSTQDQSPQNVHNPF